MRPGGELPLRRRRGGPLREPRAGPGLAIAGLILLLAAGLAGAGWYGRAGIAALLAEARLARAAPLAEPAREAGPPGLLPDGLEAFGEGLTDRVLAVIGTGAEDRPLAFTPLANGEIAVLIETGAGDGEGGLWLVRLGGGSGPGVQPVAGAGAVLAASLAPAGLDGVYLALTHESEVRLLAYGAGGLFLWERRRPHSGGPVSAMMAAQAGGLAYLLAPAEAPGRLSLAASDSAGRTLWQRSFEAAEDARAFAGVLDGGGVYAVFETSLSVSAAEAGLVFLSEAGETLRRVSGISLPGRLAGAGLTGEGAALLVAGEMVSLLSFTGEGPAGPPLPLAGARSGEAVFLTAAPGEGGILVSALPLAGVLTDLTLSRPAEGAAPERSAYRLPGESRVTGAAAIGRGAVMIAGILGEGASADAFLMLADLEARGPLLSDAGPSGAEAPGAGPEDLPAPLPLPLPESVTDPGPEPGPDPGPDPGPLEVPARLAPPPAEPLPAPEVAGEEVPLPVDPGPEAPESKPESTVTSRPVQNGAEAGRTL